MQKKLKIVFMGTSSFSLQILKRLHQEHEVILIVSQPDKTKDKRNNYIKTPCKEFGINNNIEVFQPNKIKKDYKRILEVNADLLITAAYGQIIPNIVLNHFKKAINVHASLLPKYRGGAPIQRSIMNNDKKTGVTIMQMIDKMDAGLIYKQKEIDILETDNSDIMFEKLSIIGEELLIESLYDIYNDINKGYPQDESLVTYAYNLTKDEELIDFNKTSLEIFNQIRGLSSNPGAYFTINGKVIKVYESKIIPDESNYKPSTVIKCKKELIIKTKDSAISLISIKVEGKKQMLCRDFLNGQKIIYLFDVVNS